jgi:hypothetical protein
MGDPGGNISEWKGTTIFEVQKFFENWVLRSI